MESSTVANTFTFVWPAGAIDAWYRDVDGNISTSHFRTEASRSVFEMRSRYPIYGGWKFSWMHGYEVPQSFKSKDGLVRVDSKTGKYVLKAKAYEGLKNLPIDKFVVEIVMPEGATDIKIDLPFIADGKEESISYSYFDTVGKPTYRFTKNRFVDEMSGDITVGFVGLAISPTSVSLTRKRNKPTGHLQLCLDRLSPKASGHHNRHLHLPRERRPPPPRRHFSRKGVNSQLLYMGKKSGGELLGGFETKQGFYSWKDGCKNQTPRSRQIKNQDYIGKLILLVSSFSFHVFFLSDIKRSKDEATEAASSLKKLHKALESAFDDYNRRSRNADAFVSKRAPLLLDLASSEASLARSNSALADLWSQRRVKLVQQQDEVLALHKLNSADADKRRADISRKLDTLKAEIVALDTQLS